MRMIRFGKRGESGMKLRKVLVIVAIFFAREVYNIAQMTGGEQLFCINI